MVEHEESTEEFLARMSALLDGGEKREESEEEKKRREYKRNLVFAYTNQYYANRALRDKEGEAARFNASFPTWRKIRCDLYKKDPRPFYKELAEVTETLVHDDFIAVYQEQVELYEEQLLNLMPGTDRAREASGRRGGWIYLREVMYEAKRLNAEGGIDQLS